MLALLVPMILLLFLAIGGLALVLCAAAPPLRRYALSSALWFAIWGPCIGALIVAAGTALVAEVRLTQRNGVSSLHLPHPSHAAGWAIGVGTAALIAAAATGVAWLHQAAIHRLTLPLFRIYAAGVCGGFGAVFGVWLSWWLIGEHWRFAPLLAITGVLLLSGGFGRLAWRGARSLRGDAPSTLTWITEEEFYGV